MAPRPDVGETASDERLARRIGHRFTRPELLGQALAHRSWCSEQGGRHSNERLEFLGDAVLGLVVAEYSYRTYADLSDGMLSKVRASVVNAHVLAELAVGLGIPGHLRLGKGEDASGGRAKVSILADAMEAVIAAVYLDGGAAAAQRLIDRLFENEEDLSALRGQDDKGLLQTYTQARDLGLPEYAVVEESGPAHDRRFVSEVRVAGSALARGEGASKKSAEQTAAQRALALLKAGE